MTVAHIQDPEPLPEFNPGRKGDRFFAGLATGAGVIILATLAGVALFLIVKAWPAITADGTKIPGALDAWAATLSFGGQIFCDFAGYSTTAIGAAFVFIPNMPPRTSIPFEKVFARKNTQARLTKK